MLPNAIFWENLKDHEFTEAVEKSKGVCVIPIGAMEKHGPHMPVGTDNMIARETARLAAMIEPVVLFPEFSFGNISGLQYLKGSICLSNQLILNYLDELCQEIARSGFNKILFLNAHGGNNSMLTTFCNSMREKKRDYVVMYANSFRTTIEDLQKAITQRKEDFPEITQEDEDILHRYFQEVTSSGHADYDELLLLYELLPETVDISLMGMESGENNHRTDHLSKVGIFSGGMWLANFPNSYAASYFPHINHRLSKAYLQLRVEYIAKIFKTSKEDQTLLEINEEWNHSW